MAHTGGADRCICPQWASMPNSAGEYTDSPLRHCDSTHRRTCRLRPAQRDDLRGAPGGAACSRSSAGRDQAVARAAARGRRDPVGSRRCDRRRCAWHPADAQARRARAERPGWRRRHRARTRPKTLLGNALASTWQRKGSWPSNCSQFSILDADERGQLAGIRVRPRSSASRDPKREHVLGRIERGVLRYRL